MQDKYERYYSERVTRARFSNKSTMYEIRRYKIKCGVSVDTLAVKTNFLFVYMLVT